MPLPQYYDDNADGWRYEKRTRFSPAPTAPQVPYYHQPTDFTSGPACLLIAMAALVPGRQLAPSDDLRIWPEATTTFLTSRPGCCGPQGLAHAAHHRALALRAADHHV